MYCSRSLSLTPENLFASGIDNDLSPTGRGIRGDTRAASGAVRGSGGQGGEVNHAPETRNLQPETRNLTTEILKPKPETQARNSGLETRD